VPAERERGDGGGEAGGAARASESTEKERGKQWSERKKSEGGFYSVQIIPERR
jgi:hypothetical protein